MNNEMIQITNLKDKQHLLLGLLKEFHSICEENGLIYNIFGGTMLGAVRHKGFIPWDDDVDVTMPRSDYNKFISIIREKYNKKYIVHNYPDENYIYPYAKFGLKSTELHESIVKEKYNMLSLNIDIFPNDGYPDDESIFEKYNKYEKAIILLTYDLPYQKRPFIKRIFYNIKMKIISKKGVNFYLKKQIEMFAAYPENSEYIVCQGAGWGKKGKMKRVIYYDRVLYDFNDTKVWGIRDYDQHLNSLYGDYMKLPPVEQRVNSHDSTLFISREIYKEYLEDYK